MKAKDMSIQDIRDPAAIRAAMEEYDRVGRAYFLDKYGFSEAREYVLREPATGCLYDSKAIVGAVYGYAFPDQAPLSCWRFQRRRGHRGTFARHAGL